ncbi:Methyltransferase domain-containing protein [Duganella sp. CF458]|uniref:class I SAM-dependent methyltransferase n=1 Tax=Duganella sp. CF458 TaxID=1884368 RepID=UPI0008F3668D|nr:class I SAM-dependent methyltransferase [Duganella sp. CF458]SFG21204.1 Methyltransferase domain-containing protein [Duganella sp. CF458]
MQIGFKPHYFEELAAVEARNFWFRSRNKLILWALRAYQPGMRSFLEIGCGTGFVLSAVAAQFPQARMAGSEHLAEGLDYARQRVSRAEFSQMDARAMPYREEWDAIGAFDVIEHIKEDKLVLDRIHAALKPGGHVYITVPQHRWLWSAVDEYACHERRYTAAELHHKVAAAGFELVRSTSFVSLLLPMMLASRLAMRGKKDISGDDIAGLRVHPVLNRLLEVVLSFELAWIRCGGSWRLGGTRLLVARKSSSIEEKQKEYSHHE